MHGYEQLDSHKQKTAMPSMTFASKPTIVDIYKFRNILKFQMRGLPLLENLSVAIGLQQHFQAPPHYCHAPVHVLGRCG